MAGRAGTWPALAPPKDTLLPPVREPKPKAKTKGRVRRGVAPPPWITGRAATPTPLLGAGQPLARRCARAPPQPSPLHALSPRPNGASALPADAKLRRIAAGQLAVRGVRSPPIGGHPLGLAVPSVRRVAGDVVPRGYATKGECVLKTAAEALCPDEAEGVGRAVAPYTPVTAWRGDAAAQV